MSGKIVIRKRRSADESRVIAPDITVLLKQAGPGFPARPGQVAVDLLICRQQRRHVPTGFHPEMRAGGVEDH